MTAEGPEEQPPSPTPVVPPDLRLRGDRPRVTRLSRRVLIGLGAVSALAVALLPPLIGTHGLWAAILILNITRGVTLGLRYPKIEARA